MAGFHFRSKDQTLSTIASILSFNISACIITTLNTFTTEMSHRGIISPTTFCVFLIWGRQKWAKPECLWTPSFQFPFPVKRAVEGFEKSWRAHSCCSPVPEPRYPQTQSPSFFPPPILLHVEIREVLAAALTLWWQWDGLQCSWIFYRWAPPLKSETLHLE